MVLGWSLTVSLFSVVLYFVLVSAALATFCSSLYGFGLVSAVFAVLQSFMYFVLASAALAAFCFGLVSAGFAVLYGFTSFVLVSAALAAFCLVLYGLGLVSAGFAVMYFVLVSAALAAFCLVLYIWLGAGLCWFRCFVWFYAFCAGIGCSPCVLFGLVLIFGWSLPVSPFCVVS